MNNVTHVMEQQQRKEKALENQKRNPEFISAHASAGIPRYSTSNIHGAAPYGVDMKMNCVSVL